MTATDPLDGLTEEERVYADDRGVDGRWFAELLAACRRDLAAEKAARVEREKGEAVTARYIDECHEREDALRTRIADLERERDSKDAVMKAALARSVEAEKALAEVREVAEKAIRHGRMASNTLHARGHREDAAHVAGEVDVVAMRLAALTAAEARGKGEG